MRLPVLFNETAFCLGHRQVPVVGFSLLYLTKNKTILITFSHYLYIQSKVSLRFLGKFNSRLFMDFCPPVKINSSKNLLLIIGRL